MFVNRKFKKWIAVFLLLNMLNYIVYPSVSYALTSGPTAPESNSFEPVDTTDMVNLLTGDFTYNIPLLEVPGPAGGYPISLSYHAGIQLNQDASWVGLGWNLNPGAITRTVNGYPDDYKIRLGNNRSYWEGGETTVTNLGLSVGIGKFASVSAGISIGKDTYKGTGVGGYLGGSLGGPLLEKPNSPFRVGVNGRIGVSPWGDAYTSSGIGVGISHTTDAGLRLGSSIGLKYSSGSGWNAGLSGGISAVGKKNGQGDMVNMSLLGASISTNGTKPSLAIGGGSSFTNNKNAGRISSYTNSMGGEIPIVPGIVNFQFSRTYSRYWIDEIVNVYMSGSLYFPTDSENTDNYDISAYDSYDILDTEIDMAENSNPVKVLGGTFPDYDLYNVTAQGLGGNIRPYHYQQTIPRQNIKNEDSYNVENYPLRVSEKKASFRFENDFSNRLEYHAPDFTPSRDNPFSYSFTGDLRTGKSGNEGYNSATNQLAGSKHVEWFSNGEIMGEDPNRDPFAMGLIKTTSTGFVRESNEQIGAFMITNESGVIYHYSLPVHSYDEYMKSENTVDFKEEKGDTFNEHNKPQKYAYTWLLTAVTGPDYVDKNDNHLVDEGDYGYWVEFDYGKWTNDYLWRNPLIGKHRDLDGEFENFSHGKKELYYLDAIKTATHTALFVKKLRNDGKSATNSINGGSEPVLHTNMRCELNWPTSVLGLEEILLVPNEHVKKQGKWENLKSKGDQFDYYFKKDCSYLERGAYGSTRWATKSIHTKVNHFGDQVLDLSDFELGTNLREKAIRSVNLETKYDLCPETTNSFKNDKLYQRDPQVEKDGKLTLKSLSFLGIGGISLLPPTTFNYANNPPYEEDHYDMWGFYKEDFDPDIKEKVYDRQIRVFAEYQHVMLCFFNKIHKKG